MRRVLIAVLAVALIASAGCQRAQKPAEKPRVVIPKGQVLVPEGTIRSLAGQAEMQMEAAMSALKKRDLPAAGHDVRMAISFMQLQATAAKGDAKKEINASIEDLKMRAKSLENRESVASADLSSSFARAQYVLANSHMAKAATALKNDEKAMFRQELAAGSSSFKAGVAWTGAKLDKEENVATDAVTGLQNKIAEGKEWTTDEASAILSGLQAQVGRLKTKIMPSDNTSATTSGGGR